MKSWATTFNKYYADFPKLFMNERVALLTWKKKTEMSYTGKQIKIPMIRCIHLDFCYGVPHYKLSRKLSIERQIVLLKS